LKIGLKRGKKVVNIKLSINSKVRPRDLTGNIGRRPGFIKRSVKKKRKDSSRQDIHVK